VVAGTSAGPPASLALVAHPVRWRLLTELADGDRQVGELTSLTGLRQSLVSYHLAELRTGGLVSMRRSSADGREAYYRADLERCGAVLMAAGTALHPGLQLVPAYSGGVPSPWKATARLRVLFLCTGNGARSQIAEALTQHLSGGAVEAASAGSHPTQLHRNAVRVMCERGIDISGRRTKHLRRFARHRFDYVISLCDRLREICPEFPGDPRVLHWSIPDPAHDTTNDDESYPAFERTAADLEIRIRFLLHRLLQPAKEVP
jgi:ArsR family transcriptional regulator, arsenate/arsenite/antimonite-responsive transcriptional repressor / arsenate reductase (thioredoxin)